MSSLNPKSQTLNPRVHDSYMFWALRALRFQDEGCAVGIQGSFSKYRDPNIDPQMLHPCFGYPKP